ARASETLRAEGLFVDNEAVRVVEQLGSAAPRSELEWKTYAGIVVRTNIIDRVTRRYLASAPAPLVVNLGAGLCTRYYRLGRPAVDWIDIDFPDVIALRRRLLPETAQHHAIACSLIDKSWVDQISGPPGTTPLFIAEGLLWYLRDADIKELLMMLN